MRYSLSLLNQTRIYFKKFKNSGFLAFPKLGKDQYWQKASMRVTNARASHVFSLGFLGLAEVIMSVVVSFRYSSKQETEPPELNRY